ncbi:MAG TPA: hypothetical protein DEH78_05025, partial [Solibacterales bacterium]|nr:hypothetical protein [Bryobacterales bacterium]
MGIRSLIATFLLAAALCAQDTRGYYRFPAIHGASVVFTAEGDLWQVGVEGGVARRLTTHLGAERGAAFSPDGKTALSAGGGHKIGDGLFNAGT